MEPQQTVAEAMVDSVGPVDVDVEAVSASPQPESLSREPVSYRDLTWARMDSTTQPMVVTIVLHLDSPLDEERLKATLRNRLLAFARFRQRLVRVGGRTYWLEDGRFALEDHIRWLRWSAPADSRALQRQVGELASEPLDEGRPLWRCVIVDPVGPGCAVVFRVHHCIADGIALLRVFLALTDPAVSPPADGASVGEDLAERRRRHARLAAKTAKSWAPPSRWGDRLRWGMALAWALLRQAVIVPDTRTALRGRLNGCKRVAWSAPIPLTDIAAIRQRWGGRVNDVMLVVVTGALRRYLLARGELHPTPTVRLVVPVNLRPYQEDIELGNRFAVIFLKLPLAIADPAARLAAIRVRTEQAKSSLEAVANLAVIGMMGRLPAWLERLALRLYGLKATAVMTNVPGPEEPLTLAGAPVGRILAWVPQITGIGIGISVLSHAGAVTVGITSDSGVVAEPWELVAGIEAEMAALRASARALEE